MDVEVSEGVRSLGLELTWLGGQGWCVDHAAVAAVSWRMVASSLAGLR